MEISSRSVAVAVGILIVSASASALGAQTPPKPQAPAPERATAQPSSSFVVEQQQVRVRLELDGGGTREMTTRVRVHDAMAVRQWGQLTLSYAPFTEALEIVKLQILKADGRRCPLGPTPFKISLFASHPICQCSWT